MPQNRRPTPHRLQTTPVETPPADPGPMAEGMATLLQTMAILRRKIREINKARGRTSLTLHLTRLELSQARTERKAAVSELEDHAGQARRLYYMLREVMEVTRPGMAHGELDDDYKLLIAELRRLRSLDIVAQLDAENAEHAAIVTAELIPRDDQ
jgi:hypothetical protein